MNFERGIHPLTMVVGLISTLQRFAILIIIVVFNRVRNLNDPVAAENNVFEFMIIGIGGLSIVGLFVNYLVTRFGVENNQFYLRSGWLQKQDRRIPLDRIQSVDIQRDFIPKLLGLAAIKIDTGAHEKGSEVRLQYVSSEDADEIVRRLSRGTSNTTGVEFQPPVDTRPIWKTSFQELLTAGATENRALVMAAAVLGIMFESERFGFKSQDLIQKVLGTFDPAKATQQTWVAGGLLAFAILVLGWIVSMGSTVIRWHGFKIIADQGKLIRTFGLLNEHRTTLVVRRVQTVELRSSLIRRFVGLWEVHVRTAGQKLGEERDGDGRNAVTGAFVPIVDREELPLCINMVLPGFDYVRLRIERTSPKMALRVAIATCWFWLAVSTGLVVGLGQKYAWTFAFAVVFSAALGFWRSRVCGYGRVRDVLAVRDGLSMLRTGLIPDSKLQSVTLRSDPIDRLFGLVNIGYTTAGMRGHISCLDKEKGLALYEDLCSRMNASGDWHPDGV